MSDKKKTSSLLSFFIEDCKQIIDNAIDLDEEGKRESQLKLEEEWTSLIEERLNNDKFFVNRYQALSSQEGYLLNSVKSAGWGLQGRIEALNNTKQTLIAQKKGCEEVLSNPNTSLP